MTPHRLASSARAVAAAALALALSAALGVHPAQAAAPGPGQFPAKAPTPAPPPVAPPAAAKAPADRPTADQGAVDGDPKARAEALRKGPARVGDRAVQVVASIVVKVVHPAEVRRTTIESLKAGGGWPLLVTDQELHLAVPLPAVATVIDQLSAAGIVLQKSLQRVDRTEEIVQLQAKLKSKREILARLRGLLDDADTGSTLRVEGTMNQLLSEVEQLQGDLNVAEASVRMARVVVSFQYHQRQRITYVRSPFQWLNQLDIDRFLADF